MPSNLPQFTLRVSLPLMEKLHYVARQNARSANREIELLIKNHIAAYEQEHGPIELDD